MGGTEGAGHMKMYRVEIERLDHGYEARVPEIDGFLCEGLTEGETLKRLRQKLDLHLAELAGAAELAAVRLEVYRT
jgi:predicted RNase H-like HicB family nuclease